MASASLLWGVKPSPKASFYWTWQQRFVLPEDVQLHPDRRVGCPDELEAAGATAAPYPASRSPQIVISCAILAQRDKDNLFSLSVITS